MPRSSRVLATLGAVALAAALAAGAAAAGPRLVVCAPGFPGTTESARDVMDDFAALATRRASRSLPLSAEYHPDEASGLASLRRNDAALALVPLPFFLAHEAELELQPLLGAEQGEESGQVWSLVAPRGRVRAPADLAGFEVVSVAGYAPRFVRGPALGAWGGLPESARVVFTDRLLPALRRAAAGEPVALLLDAGQARSLAALPFAGELETVARTAPLPDALLCAVGGRMPHAERDALASALAALHDDPSGEGPELLAAMRMSRFVPVDRDGLERARTAYAAAPE